MGLLKDIILPMAGVEIPGKRKQKDSGPVRSTSGSDGGGIDAKRRSGGGGYIGDEAAAGNYKRGGKVKRTGLARVHKGERVLTQRQAKRYSRTGLSRKRSGGSKR